MPTNANQNILANANQSPIFLLLRKNTQVLVQCNYDFNAIGKTPAWTPLITISINHISLKYKGLYINIHLLFLKYDSCKKLPIKELDPNPQDHQYYIIVTQTISTLSPSHFGRLE
jgi:hypothetical protein